MPVSCGQGEMPSAPATPSRRKPALPPSLILPALGLPLHGWCHHPSPSPFPRTCPRISPSPGPAKPSLASAQPNPTMGQRNLMTPQTEDSISLILCCFPAFESCSGAQQCCVPGTKGCSALISALAKGHQSPDVGVTGSSLPAAATAHSWTQPGASPGVRAPTSAPQDPAAEGSVRHHGCSAEEHSASSFLLEGKIPDSHHQSPIHHVPSNYLLIYLFSQICLQSEMRKHSPGRGTMGRGLCPCTFCCPVLRLAWYSESSVGRGVWLSTMRAHRGAKATRLLSPLPAITPSSPESHGCCLWVVPIPHPLPKLTFRSKANSDAAVPGPQHQQG